jgi:transposase
MQEDGGRIKPMGKMYYERFMHWVQKKLAEGWEIHSCYEARASGYWLHRELVAKGVKNLVVAPKPMDKGGKKQKSDKRDGVQLCDALERYLRGQDKALSVVSVPTPEQEQNRALIRYHRQVISDRVRCEARGKGLLCAQGIQIQGQWWQEAGGNARVRWILVEAIWRLRSIRVSRLSLAK